MTTSGESKMEGLTRYLFRAPSWPYSLLLILLLGIIIDVGALIRDHSIQYFGTFGFVLPALIAFLFTAPLVQAFGATITPNRSALLCLACTVFAILISLFPIFLIIPGTFWVLYAIALGFIFWMRLITLVAVADYHVSHMILPALLQSGVGIITGYYYFGEGFVWLAGVFHIFFLLGLMFFISVVARPLKKNLNINVFNFINAFIAHNTDGSRALEDFFRDIGEEVYTPQTSIFFRREGKEEAIFTVPNVHPGPMGEIGGGNLPNVLSEAFGKDIFVAHGCATHDFNIVSESEVDKVSATIRQGQQSERIFSGSAGRSRRYQSGTVSVLAQQFGDTILLVGTRSPKMTEDLDFPLCLAIMGEGHKFFTHVAFADAHNAMVDVTSPVMAGSKTAHEYLLATKSACAGEAGVDEYQLSVGTSHLFPPFSREEGFGDQGIQVLLIKAGDQTTAYILIDGNNIESGVRDYLRKRALKMVDECEIMTTDSHVVNTMTGRNPVGYRIPADDIWPHLETAISMACDDLSEAEAAGSSGIVMGIVVFGSQRISQLAGSVNTMLSFAGPLGITILLLAFLFAIIAYIILV